MEVIKQEQVINPASDLEDMALTATLPHEMVDAQNQLIDWCARKISIVEAEVKELYEAWGRAKKMKWKDKPIYNLHRGAIRRLNYYVKVKCALIAGYYIVPNFPIQMFAIKTKKNTPKDGWAYGSFRDHKQDPQELSTGEGEYRNPFPLVEYKAFKDNQTQQEKEYHRATDWDDLEFPIMMAKPNIMDAVNRAISLKIFDQIGIMPAARKEDPVIIGQIFRKQGYSTKIVSFMIAWHLDTSMI